MHPNLLVEIDIFVNVTSCTIIKKGSVEHVDNIIAKIGAKVFSKKIMFSNY